MKGMKKMQNNDRWPNRRPFRAIHIETVLDQDSMLEHQSMVWVKDKDDRKDNRMTSKKLSEIHKQLNRWAVSDDDQEGW